MSKAFTSEDVAAQETQLPLPVGRRPITVGGLAQLRRAHAELLGRVAAGARAAASQGGEAQRQAELLRSRLRSLERLIALSDVVPVPPTSPQRVLLGTRVIVREDEEEGGAAHVYVLVGPDEVDVSQRRVSYASPVGRALMGRSVGERAFIKRPAGVLEVVVVSIEGLSLDVADAPG